MQAEDAQHPVHHVGHPGHVAEVLQEHEHGEHDADKRRKAHDRSHAADHAGDNERLQVALGKIGRPQAGQPLKAGFDPALGIGPDGEGDLEHEPQDGQHDDGAKDLVGHDAVDGVRRGAAQFVAAGDDTLLEQAVYKTVAPVGNDGVGGGGAVLAGVDLGLFADGLQPGGRAAGGPALVHDLLVGFEILDGHPAGIVAAGQKALVLNDLGHALDDRIEFRTVGQADGLPGSAAFRVGYRHCLHEFLAALPHPGHTGNDRHTQKLGQLLDVNGHPVALDLVHHVEAKDHGRADLHELHGQIEAAFQGRGINHVDDNVGMLVHDDVAGDQLFHGIGGQGVGAGEVHEMHVVAVIAIDAFQTVDGDAGIVAHPGRAAGDGVKHRGFAAVGLAGYGHADGLGHG
ncbi:hypothetical protein DVDV_4198 [Desulfovibrio sp. DV]|nr:hypothetical protein DVDV_4198 [Desulfovibrio sp. DV]